jgi:tRNA threonylcarbamoyladenosine biosynthesis protein TsaE
LVARPTERKFIFKQLFRLSIIFTKTVWVMEIIFDLDDIEQAAKEFVEYSSAYRVFAFTGELGAGKTTFINAVCKQLGVKETVTSPTYAIIQEYHFEKKSIIYHIDMYRIKNVEEAIEAGVEDCLLSDKLCMVEWPERAILLFPPETVYASLQAISANMRKLIVQFPQ